MADPVDLDKLHALAVAATPGPWEAWFNQHGDPYVTEPGRGAFGAVALISTRPEDYGKANAEFIAALATAWPQIETELCDLRQLRDLFLTEARRRIEANPALLDGPTRPGGT